jgi:hypothetical protein
LAAPLVWAEPDLAERQKVEQRRREEAQAKAEMDLQKVVRVKRSEAKASVRKKILDAGAEIVIEGDRFLLVRPGHEMDDSRFEALLTRLRKEPEVAGIQSDRILFPQDFHEATETGGATGGATGAAHPPPAAAAARDCRLYPPCAGANPAWARMQVGADQADKIVGDVLKETGKASDPKVLARVGVADSGFDLDTFRGTMATSHFAVAKGHDAAGEMDIDPDGHGTAVAGMIAGRGVGITQYVDLTVFRVTGPNSNGSTSDAFLAASIEKACETSDVVNVSWGSMSDEYGFDDIKKELWYRKAVEKGCLIVKAAGNSGNKTKKLKPIPAEIPFLSVAASNAFTTDSSFSTNGALSAPGEGVYSLLSAQHQYSPNTNAHACGLDGGAGRKLGPVDGTSFASPLVAGIAAQVITILNARSPGKLALPENRKDRIKLVKNILLASAKWSKTSGSRQPVVNALVAAQIAQRIALDNGDLSIDAMIQTVKRDPTVVARCQAPSRDCAALATCDAKKTCVNDLRYRLTMCLPPGPNFPEDKKLVGNLFGGLRDLGESDLLLQLFDRIPASDTALRTSAREVWDQQWNGNLRTLFSKQRANNIARSLDLLDAARRGGFFDDIHPVDRVNEILNSFNVGSMLDFEKPIGTSPYQSQTEAQAAKFFGVLTALTEDQQMAIARNLPKLGTEDRQSSSGLNLLYYLYHRRSDLKPAVKRAVEDRVRALAADWRDGKYAPDTFDAGRTIPALEMLYDALSADDKKKIQDALKGEITDKNRNLFLVAMQSDKILGADRIAFVRRLITGEAAKKEENADLLNAGIEILIRTNTPAGLAAMADVRKALLENPGATLPVGVVVGGGTPTDNQKAVAADGFYPKFVLANVKRGIDEAKKEQPNVSLTYRVFANLNASMIGNPLFTDAQRRTFFTGDDGKQVQEYLKLHTARVVKADKVEGPDTNPWTGMSFMALQEILPHQKLYVDAGFRDRMRESLMPLKKDAIDDARKHPAKYPQRVVVLIRRLYELGE